MRGCAVAAVTAIFSRDCEAASGVMVERAEAARAGAGAEGAVSPLVPMLPRSRDTSPTRSAGGAARGASDTRGLPITEDAEIAPLEDDVAGEVGAGAADDSTGGSAAG